jgi:hypothetical protein
MNHCTKHYPTAVHFPADTCPYCEVERLKGELTEVLIENHLLKQQAQCDQVMFDRGRNSAKQEIADLQAKLSRYEGENKALKEELFDKDTVDLIEKCKEFATENFKLKAELKRYSGAVECEGFVNSVGELFGISKANTLKGLRSQRVRVLVMKEEQ